MKKTMSVVVLFSMLAMLLTLSAGVAFANPEDAPGAGDITDVANEQVYSGPVGSIPGPQSPSENGIDNAAQYSTEVTGFPQLRVGLNNNPNSTAISGEPHNSSHAIWNNPICRGHSSENNPAGAHENMTNELNQSP